MTVGLILMTTLGIVGAFDTIYYHEIRGRLPARPEARPELRLHAARDAVYFLLFVTLPWVQWQGAWAIVLVTLFAAEIIITLNDFVLEDRVRVPQGGVFPGERVAHAVMGIIYGSMLAAMTPTVVAWLGQPTALTAAHHPLPSWFLVALTLMGVGTLLSGVRDAYAAAGLPGCSYPWTPLPHTSVPTTQPAIPAIERVLTHG
jgi:hypothetical protein